MATLSASALGWTKDRIPAFCQILSETVDAENRQLILCVDINRWHWSWWVFRLSMKLIRLGAYLSDRRMDGRMSKAGTLCIAIGFVALDKIRAGDLFRKYFMAGMEE